MKTIIRFLALLSLFPALASGAQLQPFSLTYAVNYSIAKGEMTLSLSSNGKGQYTLNSLTQAKGLAKLAVPDPVKETATFEISDEQIRGLSYRMDDGDKDKNEDIQLTYNWDSMQAEIQSKEGKEQIPLSADTYDQLIMQAVAMLHIQAGEDAFSFKQIKLGRGAYRYQFTKAGEETVSGPNGGITALKYALSTADSDKKTYYWFAPEMGYAPVRIERFKKDKSVFKGVLKTIH